MACVVSVVVPFWGSERHVAQCIDSLLAQDDVGGPYEVILVDNGSQDASASIVARYPDLIVLEERTPGAYAARNTGIRRATAPLVAFTDADCVVDRHWLRAVRAGMADPSVGVVVGECQYPSSASPALHLLGAYENLKAEYVIERCARAHHFAYANNMAVRRALFEELGPFREWRRAADSEFVHRLSVRKPDLRLAYCPAMRVTHLEFLRTRDRIRRLSTYTRTNTQIDGFRELRAADRIGLLGYAVRRLVGRSVGTATSPRT